MVLAPLPIMIFTLIAYVINKVFAHVIVAFFACLLGISAFAWFVMGIILRFKHNGSFSTGSLEPSNNDKPDWYSSNYTNESLFQYKSGNFMLVFYVLMFVIQGLACCVGGVYGIPLLFSSRN